MRSIILAFLALTASEGTTPLFQTIPPGSRWEGAYGTRVIAFPGSPAAALANVVDASHLSSPGPPGSMPLTRHTLSTHVLLQEPFIGLVQKLREGDHIRVHTQVFLGAEGQGATVQVDVAAAAGSTIVVGCTGPIPMRIELDSLVIEVEFPMALVVSL